MSQTTYSNEEIKHLFQTLYEEKKRNKELLAKLQQQESQVTTYTTHQNSAAEAFKQFNMEKAELTDENNALQQQVSALKKQIDKLNEELKKRDPRQVEILHQSLERQNALEYELRLKIEEIDFLKKSNPAHATADSSDAKSKELEDLVELLQEELRKSKEENDQLKIIENEAFQIKQALTKSLQESKELSGLYQIVLRERSEAILKCQQYLRQVETQRQEILRLQNYTSRERDIKEKLQAEVIQLKEIALKSEHLEADLAKAKQRIDALDSEIALERHMRRDIDEELDRAQHHLAKKVKENALFEQKTEEIQQQLLDAQKALTENKMTIGELQTSLELYRQQESRLNEQLKEASKAAETQIAKSEERIFGLSQKLEAAENRVKELQKIEEKQHRLEKILSDAAALFPSNKVVETAEPQRSEPTPSEEKVDREKHFSDLFEMPKPPQKHRRTLLD